VHCGLRDCGLRIANADSLIGHLDKFVRFLRNAHALISADTVLWPVLPDWGIFPYFWGIIFSLGVKTGGTIFWGISWRIFFTCGDKMGDSGKLCSYLQVFSIFNYNLYIVANHPYCAPFLTR
jgi:hypothetical protein